MALAYTNSAAVTITLASLASTTADPPVGQESAAYDVGSNLPDDLLLGGKITTGTSPTASKQIQIWAIPAGYDGSSYTYAGGATGSNAGLTPGVWWKDVLTPVLVINTDNTSNKTYAFEGISFSIRLRNLFLPIKLGLFVFHNTGVNLHATGSNHALTLTKVTR